MDTNKKAQDVDHLLHKALKSTAKPDAILLGNVKREIAKKEMTYLNKPNKRRPLRKIAALIAATLALTTTVFASAYLGSFDRLREIVGPARAEVLQPLEIVSHPEIPEVTKSQYEEQETDATNPEVHLAANNLLEAGIRAELVAVGVFDNVVDIYITLKDLISDRLDGYFQVGHIVSPVGEYDIASLSLAPEIIDRSADGVVTIRSREIFTHSVAGMELSSTITGINYNISTPYRQPNFRDLGIDFTALTQQPTALFRPDFAPAISGGGSWNRETFAFAEIEEKMQTEGFAVLQPHQHDIEVDLGGETAIISSIGFIGDRLHVQIYHQAPDSIFSHALMFYDYNNLDARSMGFGFRKDSQGNLVRAEVGERGFEYFQYREYILFDVDFNRLSDLRARGGITCPSFDRMEINWSVNFDVPVNEAQIIAEGLNLQYESATITEIRVTPFLIQLVLENEAEPGLLAPSITIHTTSGTVYPALGMSFSGFGMGSFFFDMGDNPLDLDTIISLKIGGERVVFH